MHSGYESFFGLFERPFSLTPDARYHFRSRAHARALGGLSTGLARRAPVLLLTGDLGTGKSTLCRTLIRTFQQESRVVYISNALLSPGELYQRLLQQLGAARQDAAATDRLVAAGHDELSRWLEDWLRTSGAPRPLILLDEAHLLPQVTVETLLGLLSLESGEEPLLQVVLSSQPPTVGSPTLPRVLDDVVLHRARLTALDRDECEPYIQHRLHVAGGAPITIGPKAVDVVHALSGGLPRLVNLLCERALQEAAAIRVRRLEPSMFETAAASLELLRLRSKRFRWYGTHRVVPGVPVSAAHR
ncbi:MAG: AAA family ATPase [Acidobacteria bacterium]|nr:AAA family ATPase [Acidobacteriota bacterium]